MSIFDAAEKYKSEGIPLMVIAGKEYGTGSFARLGSQGNAVARGAGRHCRELRANPPPNLVGMGVLPLAR